MTRNRSQRVALVKYTLAAPLFIVLIILLAAPKNGLMAKTEDLSNKMGNTIEAIETKVKETLEPNITKNLQSQPIPIANNSLPNNLIVKIEDGGAGGVMNVANFKKCQFLKVTQFMQEANVQWKIKDFIVQKVSKSGVSSRIKNQGNIFNNVVKALINQAETGDIFHFTDIFIASYNDNRAGNWGNISFTLTQTFMYGIPTLSTGKTGGIISKKNIQISSTSGLMLKDSKKYRVYSFKMTHYSLDKSKTSTIENNGAAFTEASKKLLEALEVGDNLKMDNIRVVDSDGKIIEIPDKTDFTIGAAELKDKVPQPFPTINGFRGMHIDLDRFKKLDEIIPYQSNEFGYFEAMPKNLGEIESFTLKKKDEGEAIFCKGNHFDAVVKQLIMNAKQGDTYRFQNIVFKMNSGVMLKWNLGEMVFIIKKVPFGDWSTRAKWFVRLQPINFFGELHSDTELVICTINRYAKGEQKPSEQVQFTGFNWSDEASQIFQKAQIGDVYEFANIKARRRGHTNIDDFASIRYKLN